MEQWKGRVAIVTGASSGIGREVAKQLALNGMIVIGCARNRRRIEVLSITVDLFYSHCTSVVYDQIYISTVIFTVMHVVPVTQFHNELIMTTANSVTQSR